MSDEKEMTAQAAKLVGDVLKELDALGATCTAGPVGYSVNGQDTRFNICKTRYWGSSNYSLALSYDGARRVRTKIAAGLFDAKHAAKKIIRAAEAKRAGSEARDKHYAEQEAKRAIEKAQEKKFGKLDADVRTYGDRFMLRVTLNDLTEAQIDAIAKALAGVEVSGK